MATVTRLVKDFCYWSMAYSLLFCIYIQIYNAEFLLCKDMIAFNWLLLTSDHIGQRSGHTFIQMRWMEIEDIWTK